MLHADLISKLKALNYPTNKKGICFGFHGMVIQAVLINELEHFKYRCQSLLQIPGSAFPLLISQCKEQRLALLQVAKNQAENELKASLKHGSAINNKLLQQKIDSKFQAAEDFLAYQKAIYLILSDRDQLKWHALKDYADTLAFLEGISIYQATDLDDFNSSSPYSSQQNLSLSFPLVQSSKLEQSGGLAKLAGFIGAYDNSTLGQLFLHLAHAFQTTLFPLALSIRIGAHAFAIGFHPNKTVSFIDVNDEIITLNLCNQYWDKELAKCVRKSVLTFMNIKRCVMTTELYVCGQHFSAASAYYNDLIATKKWQDMHAIKRLGLNTHELFIWLYMAANYGYAADIPLLIERGAPLDKLYLSATPSMIASQNGHADALEMLANAGANLNKVNAVGDTALFFAVKENHPNLVYILIQYNVSLNKQKKGGATPALMAAKLGHIESLCILSKAGANLEIPTNDGMTPLMAAAINGHSECVKFLIEYQVVLNRRMKAGYTALFLATQHGYENIALALIGAGCDINTPSCQGMTPIVIAVHLGQLSVISALIRAGADINTLSPDEMTLIMIAVQNGNEACVNLLIENNANLNLIKKGKSALSIAIANEFINICRLLIQSGADTNSQLSHDFTPVIFATINHNNLSLQLLAESGANLAVRNSDGNFPAFFAAISGNAEAMEIFALHGVNLNQLNAHGMSCALMAILNGHLDVIKILVKYGVDIFQPNVTNCSPLDIATMYNDSHVHDYLKHYQNLNRKSAFTLLPATLWRHTFTFFNAQDTSAALQVCKDFNTLPIRK